MAEETTEQAATPETAAPAEGQQAPEEGQQADAGATPPEQGADGQEAQAPDNSDGGEKEENTDQAPEEFKLEPPEGFEQFSSEFEQFSGEAQEWLKANPKASPQEALKWAAERQASAVADAEKDAGQRFQQQVETWENEAKADPEIGGDDFDANVATASKAIEAFGSDALKDVLNQSGLGSHPEVIRFAVKAGKALEDAPVLTTNQGGAKRSLTDALYGNSKG